MTVIGMTCKCSHCGSVLDDRTFGAELLSMRVTPKQTMILRALIAAQGTIVTVKELIDILWSHRLDGGPLYAEKTARHGVYMVKHKARLKGYDIVNVRGFGYRLERSNVIHLRKAA